MDAFEQRLRAVDAHKLTPWIRTLRGETDYQVETVRLEPLTRGFSGEVMGGRGAYRYSGTGRSARGSAPWSVVLKVLVDDAGGISPRAWDYPRREILAYRSGLLDDLPGGIAAPRCLAVENAGENEVWIWMAEAPPAATRWNMVQYRSVARHLGQFNGAYLAGLPIPERRWFTRGRVHEWLELLTPVLDDLPGFLAALTAPHWLTATQAERVSALWRQRRPLLRRFAALPKCLCHHDAFPRNLFPGADKTIAIDWAIMGRGVVGEDLMPLCVVSQHFLHIAPAQGRELGETLLEGYVAGLRDAGWRGDERLVRYGFSLASGLFGALASVGLWVNLVDPARRDQAADTLGASIGEVLATWREAQDNFLDLTDEAIALGETLS